MKTIIRFFEDSVRKFGDNIYMWEKRDGKYYGSTYKEIRELSHQFGAGLISMGINKGDRIGLISEGCNNWIISELGILYTGGVDVPLSVKLEEPSDIQFRLDHSGSRMVIASRSQMKKIRSIKSSLKALEMVILLDPEPEYQEKEIYFGEVLEKGKGYLEKREMLLKKDGIRSTRMTWPIFATPPEPLLIQRVLCYPISIMLPMWNRDTH